MQLPTDLPDNHGLSSRALLQFFTRIEQLQLEVNSLILLQNGKVTAQLWRAPYRNDRPQQLYSLSKSFTSIAVGIAWDHGLLNLDDNVVSFFPDKLPPVVSPNLARMTVHHLLSMNTGHHDNIYAAVAKEQDWAKAFLALDVEHEPGSHYRYSTPAAYMLSAILERVTGLSLVDFLVPTLFEPLGLTRPSWETCPMGVTAGGMGLSLPTEGIAKFGLMLLNKGVYEGRRIVSERYIRLATAEQSDNRAGADRIDWTQGYGYQFHLCRRGCYRGDGAFGQLCFVAPHEKIVIAATASFHNMGPLQTLLDLVYEHIIDGLDENVAHRPEDYGALQRLLSQFTRTPAIRAVPSDLPFADFSCYELEDNPHGLQSIQFHLQEKQMELQVRYGDARDNRLPFHFAKPMRTKDVFNKDLSMQEQEVVTYAAWDNDNTLQLILIYIETPYVVSYTIQFLGETIQFRFNMNVSMNVMEYEAAGRRRAILCD